MGEGDRILLLLYEKADLGLNEINNIYTYIKLNLSIIEKFNLSS